MSDFINTSDTMGSEAAVLDALIAHDILDFKDDSIIKLGYCAFYNNSGLQSVELPNVTEVNTYVLSNCSALTSAIFAKLKALGNYMFRSCTALTTLSFPELTTTASYAFQNCRGLVSIAFPSGVAELQDHLFINCTGLKTVSGTGLTILDQYCFSGCTSLETNSFPGVTQVGNYAFQNCSKAGVVALPACTTLGTYLGNGTGPTGFDFTKRVTLKASTFRDSGNMVHLVLRSNQTCTLSNVNAFTNTPIAAGLGYIYVPADLVDTYKAASNWSTYAAQIQPISAYPKTFTGSISDTWTQIFEAEQNGTYSSKYAIGDTKVVNIGGAEVLMQIVAMDTDILASDNTQTVPITWISVGILEMRTMNATETTLGGWADSAMRTYMRETLFPEIESTVRLNIKEVTKTYRSKTPTDSTLTTSDTVWIPSGREIFGGDTYEGSGVDYTIVFDSAANRIKHIGNLGAGEAQYWWLRSASNFTLFRCVTSNGPVDTTNANNIMGLVLGFCT